MSKLSKPTVTEKIPEESKVETSPQDSEDPVQAEDIKQLNIDESDNDLDESDEIQEPLFDYHEQNPSNWIVEEVDDTLLFTNSNTGRTFQGTVEEFNVLMRASLAQD